MHKTSSLLLIAAVGAYLMGFFYDVGYFWQWGVDITSIPYQWSDSVSRVLDTVPWILLMYGIIFLLFWGPFGMSLDGDENADPPPIINLEITSRWMIFYVLFMGVLSGGYIYLFFSNNDYRILFIFIATGSTILMSLGYGKKKNPIGFLVIWTLCGAISLMGAFGAMTASKAMRESERDFHYVSGEITTARYVAWLNRGVLTKDKDQNFIFISADQLKKTSFYISPAPAKTYLFDKLVLNIKNLF